MANFAPPQRRTTDGGDAFAATCARVRDEVNRGLRFGELRAGRFVDDRRRAIVVDRFARCFYSLIGEQRIGLRDLLHAKCAEHFLDRDRRTEPAHERCTRAWMRLRTGHRGGRVIEHYDGDVMLVVNRIGRAGHPGSEERGITHERDRFLIRLYHIEALRHRDARAHVETGIDCIERRSIAKRVAADITAHHRFAPATERLLHGIERTAMRASCTQDCGAVGYRVAEFDRALSGSRKIETEEFLDLRTDRIDRVFATCGSGTRELALYLESRMQLAAEFEQFVFDHMIELFER